MEGSGREEPKSAALSIDEALDAYAADILDVFGKLYWRPT